MPPASAPRSPRRSSGSRSGARAPGRRDGQGRRHRHVLHLRRPHRCALVARAAPAHPVADPAPAGCTTRARNGSSAPRRGAVRRAGGGWKRHTVHGRRSSPRCGHPATSTASRRHPAQTNFFERGEKPLEIVTTRQWYIRNGGRDPNSTPNSSRGDQIAFHPAFMRSRYANWVAGPNGDWLVSAAALLPARPSRSGIRWTRTGNRWGQLHSAERGEMLPVDPMAQPAPGYPRTSAASPAVSSATPTSSTPGRPSSLTPQIALGWRRMTNLRPPLPDGHAPPGARHHPTWLCDGGARALGVRFDPVDQCRDLRLHPRPGPQEDEQVQGQRGHARGHPQGAQLRRGALLGGQRPASGPTRPTTSAR